MRKTKRLFLLFCLCALWANLVSVPAAADTTTYFSYSLEPASASGGELVRLNVQAYETEETAAGFRLRVQYDQDKLEFLGTETDGAIKSGTMRTSDSSGLIYSVYVCNTEKGYAPRLSGTIVSFLFQVSAQVKPRKTVLSISADQICDYDGHPLEANRAEDQLSLKILSPLSPKASLTELRPSVGTLDPEFSPSVCHYSLAVDSGVNSVDFQTAAAEGGNVRVCRKTLNAAGQQTQIVITVTSADRTETAEYLVTVRRAAKDSGTSASSQKSRRKSAGAGEPLLSSGRASRTASGGGAGTHRRQGKGQTKKRPLSPDGESGLNFQGTAGTAMQTKSPQQTSSEKPLVLVGDRMPSFFTGILAAALCVTVGIAISLWLPIHRRP